MSSYTAIVSFANTPSCTRPAKEDPLCKGEFQTSIWILTMQMVFLLYLPDCIIILPYGWVVPIDNAMSWFFVIFILIFYCKGGMENLIKLCVNLGLDLTQKALRSFWKTVFPSVMPLAIISEISPCFCLLNRFISFPVQSMVWVFLCACHRNSSVLQVIICKTKRKSGESSAQKKQYWENSYCWNLTVCC